MLNLNRIHHSEKAQRRRTHRTVVRKRQLVFSAVIGLGVALAACGGGGGSVDLSPVATKVQVAENGFSFPNFPSTAYTNEFNAGDVTSMFGSGPTVCVSGRGDSCELTAEAAAFARMVNQSRASGHCEGLVAVALTRFDTSADPPTVKLPDQDETIHTIMRAFATQFIPEAQADVEKWLGKSLEEKIAALVESFKTGKLNYTLGVYVAEGGHALLPYAVEFPSKDNARIMVYDTNWPGKNRYIDVDLKAKTWRFSFSGEDPANDPNEWTGGPGDMDLTAFETRNGTCPFCGDGTKTSTTTMLVRTTNLDWSVEANGQVLTPGGAVDPASGVVVKPVKGLDFVAGGRFSAKQRRSAYDYLIRIPNKPAKAGQAKTRSKLKFSGTTSLFAVTPTGIAQVNTPGNANIPVEVGENSIVSKDPSVQLTLASGNLVATASGPGASLTTSADGNMEVTVTTASGQVVKQEVTPEAPAAKVTADATGGVTALVAAASGEVVKREVSSTGVETKTTTTETLDLNATAFKAPPGLESKPIEALPSLEKRNLANPEYKADAPYVAPTTTTTVAAKNKAAEITKTQISKFILEPAVFGDAPFVANEPTSNSNSPFAYASSDPAVATIGATTGKITVVGVGTTMISVSQETTPTFSAATMTTPLKVTKAAPKIGPFLLVKKTFGDDPYLLKPPVSTSNADFVYDSTNEAVAKVNASTGRITIVGAGTTSITATQPATPNFETATTRATLTVAKGAITFASSVIEDVTYGAADFSLTAPTSESKGLVTFSSTTPDVATVDTSTGRVSIVGAGAASLRINLGASTNFEATSQTVSFNVKRAVPTLAMTAPSDKPFGAPDFTFPVPASNSKGAITYTSVTPSVATIDATTGRVQLVGTGTVTIRASIAATPNYESKSNTVSFVALKALPTYGNFSLNSVVATTGTLQVTPPASNSASAFTYSSSNTNVATVNATSGLVTLVSAGTTNIVVSQTSNALYEASSTSASLVVTRATPVLGQFSVSAKTYGDAAFPLTPPISTSGGTFTYTSSNTAVATVASNGTLTVVGAGTAVITALQEQTGIYNSAYTAGTLSVSKAAPTYGSFSFADRESDGSVFTATAPASSSNAAYTYSSSNTSVATVNATTGAVTLVAPGTTIITASQAATSNYTASSVSAPLTVLLPSPTLGPFNARASVASPGLIGTRYTGYFSDDPDWFATATAHGETNTITDFTYFTSNTDNYSWEWLGTFVAPQSGSYEFCVASDDASYLWLGSNASSGFTTQNALAKSPGIHPVVRNCGTIQLTNGTSYPIRAQFGENGGGDAFYLSYAINGGTEVFNGIGTYYSQQPSRVGDSNYTIATPSSNSPGAFTFSSSNSAAATVNAITGEIAIVGAGTTTITATQAAAGSYRSASVSQTVTFERGIQTGLTAMPATCATGGECSVGDIGPGGGTVIYAPTTAFTSGAACGSTCQYIEIAPVNWNGQSDDNNNMFTWDCAGTAMNSTGSAIGAGYANTVAMSTNCAQATSMSNAVRRSTFGDQNDWYLPSTQESALVYGQRLVIPNFLTTGNYWTSTEVSGTNAYRQQSASQASTVKTSSGIARPIRAFKAAGVTVPFKTNSVALVSSGGNGTGARSLELVSAGSASCVLAAGSNLLTAQMSGTCTVKATRAGDANWLDGSSVNITVSFYGPAVTQVSLGVYDTCALNEQGGVSCWGYGGWGLLGDGTGNSSSEPVTVAGLTSGVAAVASGQHHHCALLTTGALKCWGYGDNGQLGTGGTGQFMSPVDAVALTDKVIEIVAGHQHTCALTVSGGVKCWGWNGYGQLGDGSTTNRFTPVDAVGLTSGVVKISAGYATTCAVLQNGNTKCWGRNDHGQVGDGTNTTRVIPTLVSSINGMAKSVASGVYNTCIITTSNTLKCWGHNGWGDLGNGTNTSSNLPVAVSNVTDVAKVSIGEGYMCALTNAGALKCWGRNENGQLGDNTTTNRSTAVTPVGMTAHVSDVSTGMFQHTCAVVNGGTLKCWGYNGWGQLGDGTTTNRNAPTDVLRMRGSRQLVTTLGALNSPASMVDVTTAPFTLAAPSASRTGTITFTSSNPSVATVDAVTGQVTVVASGRTQISASMGGNGLYSSATSVVSISVRPSNPQNLSDCQLRVACNVGDIGPAGGRVFFVDTNDLYPGVDYLEAAPADLPAIKWCDADNALNYTWGAQNLGVGMYNMQGILATCNAGAAHSVAAHSVGGYTDWYLPTPMEMQNVVSTFNTYGGQGAVNQGVANLNTTTKYWTSYEPSVGYANVVNAADGVESGDPKTTIWNVRPVRAFVSIYTPIINTEISGYNLGAGSREYLAGQFEVTRPSSLSGAYPRFTTNVATVASVGQYSGRVTHNATGAVRITATQPAWAGFSGSSQYVDYTITPSSPTLTGLSSPVTSVKTSTASFALNMPSSQSNGTITYTSSNTSVVTVTSTGAIINVVGSGQAVITATQAASGPWSSATQSILVNVAKSCADGGACVVGDTGPGGGKIFYAANTRQSWGRYLEAAPAELAAAVWCNVSQDTVGARETLVGNGQANTNAVVASCTSGAAVSADNYTINGKSDWYLPGFDELEEMYRARTHVGITSGTYWSSTEDNTSAAKRFDFAAGVYVSGTKAAPNNVRAIRSVEGPADGLTALTAGISATQLMLDNGYTGTGNYFIKPAGYSGQAVQLWCDFTNAGGGWMLIGKGRQSNDYNGGWFGTEAAIDTTGLLQTNAANAGISKVSSEFVNYLMNGTVNGWANPNPNNFLIANRLNNANDGYGGIGDSWKIKITNETSFKWINQFGSTGMNAQSQTGYGEVERWDGTWLSGSRTYSWNNMRINDMGDNDGRRLFTWHWDGHGDYHGWSAGHNIGQSGGFLNGGEGHALQFVQLWAR